MSEILLKRMEAGMLVLTLNRPDQLNALTVGADAALVYRGY